MDHGRFIRDKHEVLSCPFCLNPLTNNNHPAFKKHKQVGYDCFHCVVPGIRSFNDKPYSRYNLIVSEELLEVAQVIMTETFVIHAKDNQWYNVHNNLAKEQTNIVMVEPAGPEHFLPDEKVSGLVHVGRTVWFPLISTWNLTDQDSTLSKIKTYLLFL